MYSTYISDKRIKKAQAAVDFPLERHSIEQCLKNKKDLDTLMDGETGRLARPLRPDEVRWVRNERIVSQCDFRYWSERYAWIKNWVDQPMLFSPNVAQKIKLDIWGELEASGKAISEMDLKGRQLGVTSITELAVGHRVQFYSHVNAVIASADPDKSYKMSQIIEFCWKNSPWWLMPKATKYNTGELIEFGEQDSGISIQHGSQFNGIARGTTPTICHLSEVVDFKDPDKSIDASLLRAMHESPWMFLVLESTALGRRNWWHKTWEYAVEHWKDGRSRLCPVFLPWYVGTDIYPTKTWLRSRPIPRNWKPKDLTVKHAERARDYVYANPLLFKHLAEGRHWEMPREQMWYWEVNRAEYEAKGELALWLSEMPGDDREAFQSTHQSVFSVQTINEYRDSIRPPVGVFGILGAESEIPVRLQPESSELNHKLPVLTVKANWNQKSPHEYKFVPMKFTGYSGYDPTGKLFVWEMPEDGYEYGIGIDTSDGIGLDRSVISVIRKGTMAKQDALVAEFASAYINAFDLWPMAMAIGTFYSTKRKGKIRQAKMVIECNRNGESTQMELRKRGWSYFHQWLRYDRKRLDESKATRLGWFTVQWSRDLMMDHLVKFIRDGWFEANSPWFVEEMAELERDIEKQKISAASGGFDDRIMATGIALLSLHVMELRGPSTLMAEERAKRQGPAIYPVYDPGPQGRDVVNEGGPLERYLDSGAGTVILPGEGEGMEYWEQGE